MIASDEKVKSKTQSQKPIETIKKGTEEIRRTSKWKSQDLL